MIIRIGETVITHLGYGFFAEQRWTGKRWQTVREDGPYRSAGFTEAERTEARERKNVPGVRLERTSCPMAIRCIPDLSLCEDCASASGSGETP